MNPFMNNINSNPTFEKRTIGDCTLYLGDSLELLAAGVFGKIGAIVSDPPYGIGYQHNGGKMLSKVTYANKTITQSNTAAVIGDDVPFDPQPLLDAAPCVAELTKHKSRRLLIWGADHYMQRLPEGGTLLAWDKHVGRGGDDNFTDCEWAWCGRKVKREVFRWLWKGVMTQKSQLDVATTVATARTSGRPGTFARVHVSQKPVELMRWCIDKVRPVAGLPILDPYMGSGSTAIAALSLGHTFIGCEIDPVHFDVACRRIEAYYTMMK